MRSGEAINNTHADAPRTPSRVSRGGRLVAPVREVRPGGTQQHPGFHSSQPMSQMQAVGMYLKHPSSQSCRRCSSGYQWSSQLLLTRNTCEVRASAFEFDPIRGFGRGHDDARSFASPLKAPMDS
jgi:hypothetical protein